MGEFLRARTSPQDTIAVLGSEPQIPFYAARRSASGYLYTYGLVEAQPHARAMQEEMIREIEAAQPKCLVFVGMASSWNVHPRSHKRIFDWMNSYTAAHFEVAGVVEITRGRPSAYHLPAPPGTVAKSADFIVIYERKAAALD